MPNILWELPVPPSALLEGGPTFAIEGRKVRIALCFEHEADGPDRRVTLRFTDVEVFACTYLHAHGSLESLIEANVHLFVRRELT